MCFWIAQNWNHFNVLMIPDIDKDEQIREKRGQRHAIMTVTAPRRSKPSLIVFLQPSPPLRSIFIKPCRNLNLLRPSRRSKPFLHNRPHCTSSLPSPPSRLHTPYDLVNFRRSRFLALLNELHRLNSLPSAHRDAPTCLDTALTRAGLAHEARVISHIQSLLPRPPSETLYEIPPFHPDSATLTQSAIANRIPLIRPPPLSTATLTGIPDLLLHAASDPFATPSQRSRANPSAYIVCEIKLASRYTADYALQAAFYAHLLEENGYVPAKRAYLFLGDASAPPTTLPLPALRLLLRRTLSDFTAFQAAFDPSAPIPAPDRPISSLAPWSGFAQQMLEDADSLQLIAGIRRVQADNICEHTDAKTLEQFAKMSSAKLERVVKQQGWSGITYGRLHVQARMQLQTRRNGGTPTAFQLAERGSGAMPMAAKGDLYFDLEGFPLMPGGGLEYLFGVDCGDEGFRCWWAHDRSGEEKAFVEVVRWIEAAIWTELKAGQEAHVFHYGHYEVSAMMRIARRVSSADGLQAARKLEQLIEDGVFVDVYEFIRSNFVVGESSYSIKKIEKLVGISREGDELADAESSVGMYYEWRRKFYPETDSKAAAREASLNPILKDILKYNRQDCESLRKVVNWLRGAMPTRDVLVCSDVSSDSDTSEREETFAANDHPEPEVIPGSCGPTPSLKVVDSNAIRRSADLSQTLLAKSSGLPPTTRRIFSDLLHFYVRESLPSRAKFHERIQIASGPDYLSLFEDDHCISPARFKRMEQVANNSKKSVNVYSFPGNQPSMLEMGSSVAFVVPNTKNFSSDAEESNRIASFMTLKGFHPAESSLVLSSSTRKSLEKPPAFGVLVSSDDLKICDAPLRQSILRTAEKLARNTHDPSVSLVSSFLERKHAIEQASAEDFSKHFAERDCRAERIASFLAGRQESSVFVMQGPPGSGKTSLSGEIIRNLIMQHGKTVAISSNSHTAIDNLLSRAIRAGTSSEAVWKVGTKSTKHDVKRFKSNLRDVKVKPVENWNELPINASGALIGATCYQLSKEDVEGAFDFLFVDEASQVTIANFLAMAPCAKYAVLAGDQQQLEMPIKGSHPDALDVSCLSYIVGNRNITVTPSRGIFLNQSYRMAPRICEFVSEAFYDDALSSAAGCKNNEVHLRGGDTSHSPFLTRGSGILFVPCDEETENKSESTPNAIYGKWHRPAEVRLISNLVDELLGLKFTVNSRNDFVQTSDILVVAPFNAQVRALKSSLPDGIRVGTVDKFQGQEAPIVLVSTCASGMGEMPYESEAAGDWGGGAPMTLDASQLRTEQRGLRFALKRNRLNVAVSRAQCLALVIGEADALSGLPLSNLEDIDTASLYEQLVATSRNRIDMSTVE